MTCGDKGPRSDHVRREPKGPVCRRGWRRQTHLVAAVIAAVVAFAAVPARGVDCYTEIDPVYYQSDVRSLIHAVTPPDVERIRGELVAHIWGSSGFGVGGRERRERNEPAAGRGWPSAGGQADR